MRTRLLWTSTLALLVACATPPSRPERRAELQVLGPAQVKVVPAAGQLPHCLLFTRSERGVVRQLTMTSDHRSIPCKAGEAIGGISYRIPPAEGKVRIVVLFSDQPLGADAMAAQIHEISGDGRPISAMDLRAAGKVQVETLEFSPSAAPP
jgi:hypothetical protein